MQVGRVGDRRAADAEGAHVGRGGAGARCRRRSRRRPAPIAHGPAGTSTRSRPGEAARRRAGAGAARRRRAAQAGELDRLQHRLAVLLLVAQDQLDERRRRRRRARGPRGALAHVGEVLHAPARGRAAAGRRARRAASRTRRTSRPARGAAAAGRRGGARATGPRRRRCGRGPSTSGLMIGSCTALDVVRRESGATSASVRSRASVRASAQGTAAASAITFERYTTRVRRGSAAATRLAPHLDDLADGGACGRRSASPAARTHELEAAGLQLLELGHQRVEAAALLVHAARCRRRRCPSRSRAAAARSRRDVDQRAWAMPGSYARPDGRRPRPRPRGAARRSRRGPCAPRRSSSARRRARGRARRGSRRRRRALVAEAEQRGGVREVEAVRGGDVLLEVRRASPRDREEVEDPAAVVVEQHDRQLRARARRAREQPAEVVQRARRRR